MPIALILALISQIGVPELKAWLAARRAAGQTTLTDADVIAKLSTDTAFGIEVAALSAGGIHPGDALGT